MNTRFWQHSEEGHNRASRLVALSLSTLVIVTLAALPTTPAQASPLPTSEVEKVLSEAPLGSAGVPSADLEVPALSELLASLNGIKDLSGLAGLGGMSGLEETLAKAIEHGASEGISLGELLSTGHLAPILEGALAEKLGVAGSLVKTLVETLLHKSLTAAVGEALGSSTIGGLLAQLLAQAEDPGRLLGDLFAAVEPAKLEGLLGTSLTSGEPFEGLTVTELAGKLETTLEGLEAGLGTTLSPAGMTLTAPLEDGRLLGAADEGGNLAFGLLDRLAGSGGGEGGSGAGGGSGGPGGSGGSGGASGGSGSAGGGGSGTPGTTSIVVNIPANSATSGGPSNTPRRAAAGRVRIIGHHVHGRVATLLVQVPAAGKLALGGSRVRPVHRETSKAERISLRAVLTKAGAASARKHHGHLRIPLKVSFKIAGGPSSAVAIALALG